MQVRLHAYAWAYASQHVVNPSSFRVATHLVFALKSIQYSPWEKWMGFDADSGRVTGEDWMGFAWEYWMGVCYNVHI